MRNWIAGAMTVLGTLLVLSGATIIVLRSWLRPEPTVPDGTTGVVAAGTDGPAGPGRTGRSLLRLGPPDRLIAWGIVLLVLAAVAAGAIGFQLGANAQAR